MDNFDEEDNLALKAEENEDIYNEYEGQSYSTLIKLLVEKDEQLYMAGQYGKSLLEENQAMQHEKAYQLQELQAYIEELTQENYTLRGRLDRLISEYNSVKNELQNDIKLLQKELETAQTDNVQKPEPFSKEENHWYLELQAVEEERCKLREEQSSLLTRTQQAETDLEYARALWMEISDERDSFEKKASMLEIERNDIQMKLSMMIKENQHLVNSLADSQRTVTQVQQELSLKENQIYQQSNELLEVREEISYLRQQLQVMPTASNSVDLFSELQNADFFAEDIKSFQIQNMACDETCGMAECGTLANEQLRDIGIQCDFCDFRDMSKNITQQFDLAMDHESSICDDSADAWEQDDSRLLCSVQNKNPDCSSSLFHELSHAIGHEMSEEAVRQNNMDCKENSFPEATVSTSFINIQVTNNVGEAKPEDFNTPSYKSSDGRIDTSMLQDADQQDNFVSSDLDLGERLSCHSSLSAASGISENEQVFQSLQDSFCQLNCLIEKLQGNMSEDHVCQHETNLATVLTNGEFEQAVQQLEVLVEETMAVRSPNEANDKVIEQAEFIRLLGKDKCRLQTEVGHLQQMLEEKNNQLTRMQDYSSDLMQKVTS